MGRAVGLGQLGKAGLAQARRLGPRIQDALGDEVSDDGVIRPHLPGKSKPEFGGMC